MNTVIKILKIGVPTAISVLIIAGLLCYAFPLSQSSIALLKATRLPVAKAGDSIVHASSVPGGNSVAEFKQNLAVHIELAKITAIASRHGIHITKLDKEVFLDQLSDKEHVLKHGEFKEAFLRDIATPTLEQAALKHWFFSQEELNHIAYEKAEYILEKLKAGESFENLANEYSTDEATKDFGGDAGFMTEEELLPELREPVTHISPGEASIVASREGVHIIRIKARVNGNAAEETKYHVQDILLTGSDFEAWIMQERNTTPVKIFVK